MSVFFEYFRSSRTILTAFIFAIFPALFFFAPQVILAAWDGSPYTPGTTLTPECAPSNPSCTVAPMPVSLGGTGLSALKSGYIPFGAGTSAFATSSALYFDSTNSRLGLGTTSPYANLTIWGGSTGKIFEVVTSASTTAFSISATGFGTTTLAGLNISAQATTTSNVGMNISGGCYAMNGTCIGLGVGSGTVTSVGLSDSSSTLTIGSTPVTTSGTITATLNLGHANTWTTLQTFNYSSSTIYSSFATASTTNLIVNGSSFNNLLGTGLTLSSGALTVSSVPNSSLQNSTISGIALGANLADLTATNGTVTFSGTYNGGTARTIGLNLASANAWTALQQFNANASTTQLSAYAAYFGGTATTTITNSGSVGIGSSSPVSKLSVVGPGTASENIAYFNSPASWPGYMIEGGTSATGLDGLRLRNSTGQQYNIGLSGSASTIGSNALFIYDSNAGQARFVLNTSGNLGLGTTTPSWLLNPFSSTASQLALSAGGGVAQWAFRNAGGDLFFSTTTIAGTATTSTSAFSISGSGFGTTTLAGLNISGQATSTSNVGFNITTGCFAINNTCVGASGASFSGTVGQVEYFSGTNTAVGTSSIFIDTNQRVGIGSTTPYGLLSINPNGIGNVPEFVIGSSTRTHLIVDSAGIMAIGSTSTFAENGLLQIGTTTSVSKVGGIMFGQDTSANWYRSAASTLKTDATAIIVTGLTTSNHTISLKSDATSGGVVITGSGNYTGTSATGNALTVNLTFAPVSGTADMNWTEMQSIINQTGSASGVGRGFYVNPTFTRSVDFRSFETARSTINIARATSTIDIFWQQKTLASTTAVTVPNAFTQVISGAPIASTNVTISTSTALMIGSPMPTTFGGGTTLAGGGTVTTAYSAQIFAPVGASTNWALGTWGKVSMVGLTTATGGSNQTLCYTSATGEVIDETTTVCAVSSAKFKHDIQTLDLDNLSLVSMLKPVEYTYNTDVPYDYQNKLYGFIAEEVAAVDPHLAEYGVDGLPRTLDDRAILAITVGALQDLNLNMQSLTGNTTVTSTSGSTAFVSNFFSNMFDRITTWLADASNGVLKFFAKEVNTNTLCVADDSGAKTCINKSQLDTLLAGAGVSGNGGEPATDTTIPVITILGDNPTTIPFGSTYSDLGATVSDMDENGVTNTNLGLHYMVDGVVVTSVSIDTSTSTTHTVIYSATDGVGNTGTVTRTVIVE